MPAYWVTRLAEELNEIGQAVKGSRILVLGVTYKPDVADVRESPVLDIIRLLEARGAQVDFHDPFVCSLEQEGLTSMYTRLSSDTLRAADCVLIATNHSSYSWDWIQENTSLIVDTRYALGPAEKQRRSS